MNLLLASNSPRRKELLTQLGYQFDIVMIDVDESYPSDLKPHEIAEYVSAKKAKAFDVNENEILLIFDEVQTGIGITGKMWAFQHFTAKPDIISFGKKTQVCGVLANKEKFDEIPQNVFRESSRINSTFGGNFIDMLRFQLVLEVIEKENLVENARIVGDYLLEQLQKLQQQFPDKVSNARGRGLMCAIDLPNGSARDKVRELLYDDDLIILACGDQSIRFRPHLNVTKEEIQIALDKIAASIEKI